MISTEGAEAFPPGPDAGLAAIDGCCSIVDETLPLGDRIAGFQVLPRRGVVERTFAWISKHRLTTRDYERLLASHEAMIIWVMIALMARRLAQPTHFYQTLTRLNF
jgi:hypothetical protein